MFVAVYVALGYTVVMACFFLAWCKPFHAYYDVIPLPEWQSTSLFAIHPNGVLTTLPLKQHNA